MSVRVNGSETALAWTDGTLTGGDERFDPGEKWNASVSYGDDDVVTVRLIHEPSNTILFGTETNPATPEPVTGDAGGKIDATDSEGEIDPEDVSTPQPTGTSDGSDGSECDDEDDDDGDHEADGECDDDDDECDDGECDDDDDECDDGECDDDDDADGDTDD
ncbi:MAG: hypothetical protein ABEJ73_10870 [Haloplanus sp.]